MKPRILISANKCKEQYVAAVEAAGGIAVAQYCPDVDTSYDGLILAGGNDVNPAYYEEAVDGALDFDHARDAAEFALIEAYVEEGKPIMGICRGSQILNVAFGGSLYQDLENASVHSSFGNGDLVHGATVKSGTFMHSIYGEHMSINSLHHQAVKVLGDELEAIMTADDGVTVEAIQHNSLPIFGVQWHPERMCLSKSRDDTVDGLGLFEYFIGLCSKK